MREIVRLRRRRPISKATDFRLVAGSRKGGQQNQRICRTHKPNETSQLALVKLRQRRLFLRLLVERAIHVAVNQQYFVLTLARNEQQLLAGIVKLVFLSPLLWVTLAPRRVAMTNVVSLQMKANLNTIIVTFEAPNYLVYRQPV